MRDLRKTKKAMAIALSLAMAMPACPALADEAQAEGIEPEAITVVEQDAEQQGDEASETQGDEGASEQTGTDMEGGLATQAGDASMTEEASQTAGDQAVNGQDNAGKNDDQADANKVDAAAIDTWAALKQAINDAPDGTPTTITLACDLDGNKETEISVPEGKVITIDLAGHTLRQESVGERVMSNCGTLSIVGGGTIMRDVPCDGLKTVGRGGGIFNSETGVLSVKDCTIKDCHVATGGGGIYNNGDATLTHVTVTNNGSNDKGGGIYNAGTLTMNETTVNGNTTGGSGAGIFSEDKGALVLNECKVNGNRVIDDSGKALGGGICSEGDVTVNGGDVINNAAPKGAGIYVSNGKTLALVQCKIRNNHAEGQGGGICVSGGASLALKGCFVEENNAKEWHGGIYLEDAGAISMQGAPIVSHNTAQDPDNGKSSNLQLPDNMKIDITGRIYDRTEVYVSLGSGCDGAGAFTNGFSACNGDANPTEFFHADDERCQVLESQHDGEACIARRASSWHELDELLWNKQCPGLIVLTGDLKAGKNDGELSTRYDKTVVLDLNGHTIDRGLKSPRDHGSVINNGGNLTLINGVITGGYDTGNGGGILSYGELTLVDVKVTGNACQRYGGGIFKVGNPMRLYGTTEISGNKAVIGGGVYEDSEGISVGDSVRVIYNEASKEGDNLFLAKGKKLNVERSLTDNARIYATLEDGKGVLTSGYGKANGDTNPDCFFGVDGGMDTRLSDDGEVEIVKCGTEKQGTTKARRHYTKPDGTVVEIDEFVPPFDDFCEDIRVNNRDRGLMDRTWYFVDHDVTIDRLVEVSGKNVNLVLGEGCTLTCTKGIYVEPQASLTIWSEDAAGSGKLIARGDKKGQAGIGGFGTNEKGQGNGRITICGGTIDAKGASHGAGIGSGVGGTGDTISIQGGNVFAVGGEYAAGIGGGEHNASGNIEISGGKVIASGGKESAGIGAANKGGAQCITIKGGADVTAIGSSNAAGIGTGDCQEDEFDSTFEKITISGAGTTVRACGGKNGAGVGYGNKCRMFRRGIEINDGANVTAIGGTKGAHLDENGELVYELGEGGAGIGGGNKTEGYRITIAGRGTTVNAIGSSDAAGIGSGGVEWADDINIKDGANVTAKGGKNAAGVGGGYKAGCGTVRIQGGAVVSAESGDGAKAIGAGKKGDSDGDLELYPTAQVVKDEQAVATAKRVETCQSKGSVTVKPCRHEGAQMQAVPGGHTAVCEHCEGTEEGKVEPHELEENGYCTICGHHIDMPAFEGAIVEPAGPLGLSFRVSVPEGDEAYHEDEHVSFSIGGKSARTVDVHDYTVDAEGKRCFFFGISAIETAEPVTAKLWRGKEYVECTASVESTIDAYFGRHSLPDMRYDERLERPECAYASICNLGYYLQQQLNGKNGWKLGKDYVAATTHYDWFNESASGGWNYCPGIEAATEGQVFEKQLDSCGIKQVKCSLAFGSLTTMNIYITPKNPEAKLTVKRGDEALQAEKLSDGRYLVHIDGIKPSDLDKKIELTGDCDGAFSISCSPLAYIGSRLRADDVTAAERDALAAEYNYFYYANEYAARNK